MSDEFLLAQNKFGMKITLHGSRRSPPPNASATSNSQPVAEPSAAGASDSAVAVALAMPRARHPTLPPTPTNVNVCLVCDRPGRPLLALSSYSAAAAASSGAEQVDLIGLLCGHRFCGDCWNAHLSTVIRDGYSLLGACTR